MKTSDSMVVDIVSVQIIRYIDGRCCGQRTLEFEHDARQRGDRGTDHVGRGSRKSSGDHLEVFLEIGGGCSEVLVRAIG